MRRGSLARRLGAFLQERITSNPTPEVIQLMGKCLDLSDIMEMKDTLEIKQKREKSLMKVMKKVKIEEKEHDDILILRCSRLE